MEASDSMFTTAREHYCVGLFTSKNDYRILATRRRQQIAAAKAMLYLDDLEISNLHLTKDMLLVNGLGLFKHSEFTVERLNMILNNIDHQKLMKSINLL